MATGLGASFGFRFLSSMKGKVRDLVLKKQAKKIALLLKVKRE